MSVIFIWDNVVGSCALSLAKRINHELTLDVIATELAITNSFELETLILCL